MAANPNKAKQWMWLGISACWRRWAFFKYREFILANVNTVMTWIRRRTLPLQNQLRLPIGISFYTFESDQLSH